MIFKIRFSCSGAKIEERFRTARIIHSHNALSIYVCVYIQTDICIHTYIHKCFAFKNSENLIKRQLINAHISSLK